MFQHPQAITNALKHVFFFLKIGIASHDLL